MYRSIIIFKYLTNKYLCFSISSGAIPKNPILVHMQKNLAISAFSFGSFLLIASSVSATGIQSLSSFNSTNGADPYGSLTYNSTTGLFYGTTNS